MSDFKYKHSESLLLIKQAREEQIITEEEKRIIKEFIITREPNLDLEREEYMKDKDLRKLIETLKLMSGITQMSSPLDNNLLDMKRKKQQKDKKKQAKKKSKKEEKEEKDEDTEIGITGCDIGNSPTVTFKKFNDKSDKD